MVIYLVLTVLRHHSDVLIFTQSHAIINFTFSENDNRTEDLHDGPNRDEYDSDYEEAALPRAWDDETQRLRRKEKHPLRPPCNYSLECLLDRFSFRINSKYLYVRITLKRDVII